MKLQKMTDFVLEQYKIKQSPYNFWKNIGKYAEFLKQPLTLVMFVPCDKQGNILHKVPCEIRDRICEGCDCEDNYEIAKKRVLFEGFEFTHFIDGHLIGYVKHNRTGEVYPFPNHREIKIEDLVDLEIEMTESALKEIGIKTK